MPIQKYSEKQVLYDKEISGFKTKVIIWEPGELEVTVYDHTCWLRFRHSLSEGESLQDTFESIFARVKMYQIEYATQELFLLRAESGNRHVN